MSGSLSEIERDHVERYTLDVGDGGSVEVGFRVDEGDFAQIFLQHGGEFFLFANVAGEVELVGSLVHGELFPDEEKEEDSVLPLLDGILVGEDEAVALKAERLHLAVMEVGIELAAVGDKAAAVEIHPHGAHERDEASIAVVILDDEDPGGCCSPRHSLRSL